jgi:hypothetical protein
VSPAFLKTLRETGKKKMNKNSFPKSSSRDSISEYQISSDNAQKK